MPRSPNRRTVSRDRSAHCSGSFSLPRLPHHNRPYVAAGSPPTWRTCSPPPMSLGCVLRWSTPACASEAGNASPMRWACTSTRSEAREVPHAHRGRRVPLRSRSLRGIRPALLDYSPFRTASNSAVAGSSLRTHPPATTTIRSAQYATNASRIPPLLPPPAIDHRILKLLPFFFVPPSGDMPSAFVAQCSPVLTYWQKNSFIARFSSA